MRSFLVLRTLICLALVGCGDDEQIVSGTSDPTVDASPSDSSAGDVPATDTGTDPSPGLLPADATDAEMTDGATDGDAVTSQPADAPIPVEGEGDIGDGSGERPPLTEPPLFGVSSETDSDAVPPYTSCWSAPDAPPRCIDGFPQPQAVTLTGSEHLVITYEEGELTADASASFDTSDDAIAARPPESDLPTQLEDPGMWLVDITDLQPGDHAIGLSWFGAQGDAFTAFTLRIER